MPRYTFDPTKVRLIPEYPADEMRAIWGQVQIELLTEFPDLPAKYRRTVALRRYQERLTRPDPR